MPNLEAQPPNTRFKSIMAKQTTKDYTVDHAEIEKFEVIADQWWDPKGKFAPLHKFNPIRLGHIRDLACDHFDLDHYSFTPFSGLRVLDIGCGGGLLSEPLSRLGAQVTGIDMSERNIKVASSHARTQNLDIDYQHVPLEQLAASGQKFDIILNMEVIEHVADINLFLKQSVQCLTNKGLMFVASINRTPKAFALAILGAEYILNWLPRGSHKFEKLVRPEEIKQALETEAVEISPPIGMTYHPMSDRWTISSDTSVNYIMTVQKNPE